MPRFYFHWRGPDNVEPDLTGEELPDPAAAVVVAQQLLERIGKDSKRSWHGWSIEIVDEHGRPLSSLPVGGALGRERRTASER